MALKYTILLQYNTILLQYNTATILINTINTIQYNTATIQYNTADYILLSYIVIAGSWGLVRGINTSSEQDPQYVFQILPLHPSNAIAGINDRINYRIEHIYYSLQYSYHC